MSLFSTLFSKRKPARPRQAPLARPTLEALESRLVAYAASSNAWPAPQLITIGFVPDGTGLGGASASNLFATFNAKFGSAAAWENQILKAAQQWAQQTNINFAVLGDNGTAIGGGMYQQGDPGMADIRIGGYNFGTTALAQAYMPPPVNNTSYAGDLQLNTGKSWSIGSVTGSYDLYTVALHEIGHALGLYHSGTVSAAMYGSYTSVKSALYSDDIAGIRSIYSGGAARTPDAYDAGTGNNTFTTATNISAQVSTTTYSALLNNLNITTTSDLDYYKVTLPLGWSGALTVSAQSTGLSLLAPKVTVYASDLKTVRGTAGAASYVGGTAKVSVASAAAGLTYYIKVQGYDLTAFGTGAYALALASGAQTLAATSPNTQVLDGAVPSLGGGQPIKLNPEFLVNTTTTGAQQTNPVTPGSVAMGATGNYVVVWSSQGQDGSGWGVYAQRYNADGTRNGYEFRADTYTAGDQNYATVAMDAAGDFVVTWTSYGQDGSGNGVYAQRYSASGVAQGGEFRVNGYTAGDQMYSSAAMDDAGDLVVTWTSYGQDGSGNGVYAQRYSASGVAQGGEFRVNGYTAGDQTHSSAAMDGAGDFVITWSSDGQDGTGWGVYAQRYNADGTPNGGEFRVNTATANDQMSSAVAVNRTTGDFVITWSSDGQDGTGWGVYAQRYNAQGAAQGGEFRVNTITAGDQTDPSVAMDGNGNFLVTWSSKGQDGGGWGVYAQQYDATGTAIGTEFRVNTTTSGDQQHSSVAMDGKGDAVAVWSGNGAGDGSGVFGQRFLLNGTSGLSPMEPADRFDPSGHPARPHGPGCACPLCARIVQALGNSSSDGNAVAVFVPVARGSDRTTAHPDARDEYFARGGDRAPADPNVGLSAALVDYLGGLIGLPQPAPADVTGQGEGGSRRADRPAGQAQDDAAAVSPPGSAADDAPVLPGAGRGEHDAPEDDPLALDLTADLLAS